jgi:signal peptidase I
MLFISTFIIEGHSMEPKLKKGEKILASYLPYLFRKPKVDDIIVFRWGGKHFIKRVKKYEKNGYFVEGDNNKDSLDSKNIGEISSSMIVGKYIRKL